MTATIVFENFILSPLFLLKVYELKNDVYDTVIHRENQAEILGRADVEPYVMDKPEIDIWCADFFRQMVRKTEFA